ncbi:hypothetical protein ACHAXR_013443 [Thalassiosira sp. AJA248-18]
MMSSPMLSHEGNKCCGDGCHQFDSNTKYIQGTCKHHVCLNCVRRKNSLHSGLLPIESLSCPLPSCHGRFKIPVGTYDRGSDRVNESESSWKDIDDLPGGNDTQLSAPKEESSKTSSFLVTPISVKVKSEPSYGYDTDEYSRFSQSTSELKQEKVETDEDEQSRFSEVDEDSRFSDVSDLDDLGSGLDAIQGLGGDNQGLEADSQALVKEEPTFYDLERRQAKNSRKYGDRVLLARQAKIGMMKLGGGNQSSHLYSKFPEKRLSRMDGRYAMAYNCQWNFGAPKYAGQPSGHVTMFPEEDGYDPLTTPFSVFVMRSVKQSSLGWEYCGEYILLDYLQGTTRAHCVSSISKQCIIRDIQQSLNCAGGNWHGYIEYLRNKILKTCESDSSPPGPTRLIRLVNNEPEPNYEGKECDDRLDRESREKASSAAKARALRLDDGDLSNIDFAKRLTHYDDFYASYAIKFVSYDESMYNFVKDGMTTKNKRNKRREENEPCAKALDWYNIDDQQLEGIDREARKKRKRKRTK